MSRSMLACFVSTTLIAPATAGEPVIIEPSGARVHINRSEYADAAVLLMNIGTDN